MILDLVRDLLRGGPFVNYTSGPAMTRGSHRPPRPSKYLPRRNTPKGAFPRVLRTPAPTAPLTAHGIARLGHAPRGRKGKA